MMAVADSAFQAKLTQHIQAADAPGAIGLVDKALKSNAVTITSLYLDYLSPILLGTGDSWQAGQTAIWQEHLISSTVRTVIEALTLTVASLASFANGQVVLLACPTEEQHDLGLRMLADLFRLNGWTAYFLGANTPADEIFSAASVLDANLVVLSAATHYHRLRLRDLTTELRRKFPTVKLQVTGPAFSAGHDGWTDEEILDPNVFRLQEGR